MKSNELKKDMYALWSDCFHDSQEYMEYYFDYKLRDNLVLSDYEGERLASMIHLNPFRLYLNGEEDILYYIVGVATDLVYRKQGRMRKLLTKAFNEMYQEKKPFTYLMPAKDSIYLPYDFRYIYVQDRMEVQFSDKQQVSHVEETRFVPITKERYSDMASFANEHLQKDFKIYTIRDAYYYERLQAEMRAAGGDVLMHMSDNHITGCCSYMRDENKIEIVETIVMDGQLINPIDYFINDYSQSMIELSAAEIKNRKTAESLNDGLTISLLESHYLDLEEITKENRDYSVVNIQKRPIIMGRILHFMEFCRLLTSRTRIEFTVKFEDPWIRLNNNTYRVSIDESCGKAEIIDKESVPDVVLGAADAVELFFGMSTIEAIYEKTAAPLTEQTKDAFRQIHYLEPMYINEIV